MNQVASVPHCRVLHPRLYARKQRRPFATVSGGHKKVFQAQMMASNMSDEDLQHRKVTLEKMYMDSKKSFPDVPAITCLELQDMLQKHGNDIVLVDVRSPDEQNLSVLPGNVIKKDIFEQHKEEYRNHQIVTYCTIGVRSGKYAQQLTEQGLPHVSNLKGSIVAWTQEGLPLWKGDGSRQPTKQVHTFGKTWDLAGPGYEAVSYGPVQGGVEIVRSVLPPILGGR